MRRGIVCTALLSAAIAPHASATIEPSSATVWIAERVSPNAPQVAINAYYSWDRGGGRVTVATATVVRGRPRPVGGYTFDSVSDEGPVAHHDGAGYGCVPGSVCDVVHGRGQTYFGFLVPKDSPQPERVYLAISGHSVTVELVDSPGWRLVRTRQRTRYALSDTSGATSARVYGEQAEHFTEATLRGGPRGSIAVATAPCRLLHKLGGAREGVGTATLSGGSTTPTFDCQRDLGDVAAAADRGTVWRFAGDVVGTAMGPTRLAIIDL